jgi:hypothetical protein
VTVTLLYDWEREVRDDGGDAVVFGLRGGDGKVRVDVQQENGMLVFTAEGFVAFMSAAAEALEEAARRAQAGLPGESVG